MSESIDWPAVVQTFVATAQANRAELERMRARHTTELRELYDHQVRQGNPYWTALTNDLYTRENVALLTDKVLEYHQKNKEQA